MNATKEEIERAEKNGLDISGLDAMRVGNRAQYKRALDRLARIQPGNIWECTEGYTIWFRSAPPLEREKDYAKNEQELSCFDVTL